MANDFECVFIQFQRLLQQNTRSLRHSASNGNNLLEYETFDFSKNCDFFDIREECAIMALWDEKKKHIRGSFFLLNMRLSITKIESPALKSTQRKST